VGEIKTVDETIESIVKKVSSEVKKNEIRPDWRGDYFSSNQLDDLRRVFEKKGFQAAKIFLSGKMKPKDNPRELIKNKIILELLEQLNAAKNLDTSTKSYIIGKLNSILTVYEKGGKIR